MSDQSISQSIKFFSDSSVYVIFLLGILAIFLGVAMFMCFVHDTCPIYQYRLEKRAHKMREEDSEARRTARGSAGQFLRFRNSIYSFKISGVLPSARHRQSQNQQYLYHQHPPPARTSTSSHRTTTYGRTAPRDFGDPKPLLSEGTFVLFSWLHGPIPHPQFEVSGCMFSVDM